tara:strand:+ start:1377 stop:1697 length:321 start_codon:yes stop_codon:yes gene_type:complete
MITSLRSFTELMIISQSREKQRKRPSGNQYKIIIEESGQRKRFIRSINKNKVELPNLPKSNRCKWTIRKEAITKFFDELDYNNQIQSCYDLTLLKRQIDYNKNDVA